MEVINSSERLTNLDSLVKLANGDRAFITEMVGIFLSESDTVLRLMEKGLKENDFEAIGRSAHVLKSIIVYVGLNRSLSSDVVLVEQLAKEKTDLPRIRVHCKKIKQFCEKATIELRSGLQ